jgi:hypothetical protein
LHDLFGLIIVNRRQHRSKQFVGSVVRYIARFARANRKTGGRIRMRQDKVLLIARRSDPSAGLHL